MCESWPSERLFSEAEKLNSKVLLLEPYLASVIRELAGTHISQREAIRLAGFWLLHFVHRVFGVIEGAKDGHEICNLDIADSLRIQIPHDRREEMSAIHSDHISRAAIDKLILHTWQQGSPPRNLIIEKMANAGSWNQSRKLMSSGFDRISQPLSRGAKVWIAHPYLKISRVNILSAQIRSCRWARWLPPHLSFEASDGEIFATLRQDIARREEVTSFDSLLRALLPLMIPFGYAEKLSKYRKQLMNQFPQPPELMHSSIGLQVDHWYQVAASYWGESGTVITTHQHGGHSGLDARHVLEDLEVRTSDRYYTYGWTTAQPWVKPLPLPNPRRAEKAVASRILLMSLEWSEYVYRLQPFTMPSHSKVCFMETRQFLKTVHNRHSVVVRCGKREKDILGITEFNIGWEPLRGSGSLSASKSHLVVHNYFGTSWLETLAMNVPTVCFVPTGIHRFRAEAQPFVDALARAGVIHYSGRDAANFLNSLGANINSWWISSEVQEVRNAFASRYANFSENWLEAWRDEFQSLLVK